MNNSPNSRLIFIGTGCSTGLPQLNHLLDYNSSGTSVKPNEFSKSRSKKRIPAVVPEGSVCETCIAALKDQTNPNRRNNVSILLQVKGFNILVDCGKTFRDAALKQFAAYQVSKIDAILITHGHEDALGGIDEIRTIQEWEYYEEKIDTGNTVEGGSTENRIICHCIKPMPMYLSLETLSNINTRYPYIFEASKNPMYQFRKVSTLKFHLLSDSLRNESDPLDSPSTLPDFVSEIGAKIIPKDSNSYSRIHFEDIGLLDFTIQAIPVYHGGNYKCLAYILGNSENKVVFISDVSQIPYEIENFLTSIKIKTLIIDCLFYDRPNYAHFCLLTGLEWVEKLEPEKAYFVGMHCSLEHHESCSFLKNWLPNSKASSKTKSIELAYDGLSLCLDL